MADPRTRQWQMKLGSPGEQVTGVAELEQSLRIILASPLGSVPGRPGFGSLIHELTDEPIPAARAGLLREATRSIALQEPRLEVTDVRPLSRGADGRLRLEVEWQPTEASGLLRESQTTEMRL